MDDWAGGAYRPRRLGRANWACGAAVLVGLLCRPGAADAATPTGGWAVQLEARTSGLVDKGRLTLGAGAATGDGLDAYDDPQPQALPSRFLDLYTQHQQSDAGWGGQALPTLRYRADFGSRLTGASLRRHSTSPTPRVR